MMFQVASDRNSVFTNVGYSIQHWGADGRNLGVLEVTGAPWLSPKPTEVTIAARGHNGEPTMTLKAHMELAGMDSLGRLFATRMLPHAGSSIVDPSLPPTQYVNSFWMDVLDLQRKQIIASQQVPVSVTFIRGTQLAFSVDTDSDGVVSFTVWRVGVERP
jgi:hypothetical protein